MSGSGSKTINVQLALHPEHTTKLKIMKKVLFSMLVLGTFAFASCNKTAETTETTETTTESTDGGAMETTTTTDSAAATTGTDAAGTTTTTDTTAKTTTTTETAPAH
jgi:hypothetical protein